jgi:hypothetical protein
MEIIALRRGKVAMAQQGGCNSNVFGINVGQGCRRNVTSQMRIHSMTKSLFRVDHKPTVEAVLS